MSESTLSQLRKDYIDITNIKKIYFNSNIGLYLSEEDAEKLFDLLFKAEVCVTNTLTNKEKLTINEILENKKVKIIKRAVKFNMIEEAKKYLDIVYG